MDIRRRALLKRKASSSGGSSEGPINTDNYLTIEALEDGLTASLSTNACEYCVDGDGNWKRLAADTATESINSGHTLSFRGELTSTYDDGIGTFSISKRCNVKGDCMSMLFGDNAADNYSLSNYEGAFTKLFKDCTNIIACSKTFLKSTTLGYQCYEELFRGCINLMLIPNLPATTLMSGCYYSMFYGCTSLTNAPELPATTLADSCYSYMFYGCTGLTIAPELPATKLQSHCYYNMFMRCTGLTAAPKLPAGILAEYCYGSMFYGCTKLNYIKMLASNISARNCLLGWVSGVASSGTFVKNPYITSIPTGNSGIPSGWTVVNDGEESVDRPINANNYLTIEALEDGLTASLSTNACEYCVDGDGNWKRLAADTATESINTGQTLSFRGNLNPVSYEGIGTFTISKKCNLKGNCMSMLFGDSAANNYNLSGKNYAFYQLFYNCNNIVTVSSNFLPATTLADRCCMYMFQNCTNLTTAPELPATTLEDYCYYYMFSGCTSLTNAPELPATTLADSCYESMFNGCTSLTTAPELPATTLKTRCYRYMFSGCSKLKYIKMLATDISANNCLYSWVKNVASNGTFVKNSAMTSLPTATSSNNYAGIPSRWTIQNATS